MRNSNLLLVFLAMVSSCQSTVKEPRLFRSVSGVYPHLAFYNEGNECGTGAVVPWAGSLWAVTYSPHEPEGSSDKLYEITADLELIVREESIGGTPANRMIHPESNQLFIGPHAIDGQGIVRTIPYSEMVGRHTGNARHLSHPKQKVYYATMEEGFYEVNVENLRPKVIYEDNHSNERREDRDPSGRDSAYAILPGAHGKGLYSGQGVLVYSHNGESGPEALKQFDIESGVLAEWDGEDWLVVRRNQFVEVTGPGGIYGNANPATDPIWATGWDHKSVLLGVRSPQKWSFFRLPKASHSYDGAHGWNTEWPRIRNVGSPEEPDYLMTMHGMFWRFPQTFSVERTRGIRPRSAYLKVIGDYARWKDQLVFGCDDSAKREFLNKRRQKGGIEGPGQSNSNLWFTDMDTPDNLGPNTASGAVWLNERIAVNTSSEPFLFAGWTRRIAWLRNAGDGDVTFTFEVDLDGNGNWVNLRSIRLPPMGSTYLSFKESDQGEWIRVHADQTTIATCQFNYSDIEEREQEGHDIFAGIADVNSDEIMDGLLYGLGDNDRKLGVATSKGYYELDGALVLDRKDRPEMQSFIEQKFAIPQNVISVEPSSVLVVDDQDRRWRFPLGDPSFDEPTEAGKLRICREVATERDLFNCHGTFYELPAENADGFAKIRPIASHSFRIHDYASYRGMLVLTGITPDAPMTDHLIRSEDEQAAVWVGVIDDLWKLGKPTGRGGPWKDNLIEAGKPSDPYLIGFYDQRSLSISHDSSDPVTFRVEVEPIGHGPWMLYQRVEVAPGEVYRHDFPDDFQARWIRFVGDVSCKATAWLDYQ